MHLPKIIPISWTVQRLAELHGVDVHTANRALVELIAEDEDYYPTHYLSLSPHDPDARWRAFRKVMALLGVNVEEETDSALEDTRETFVAALISVTAQLEMAGLDPLDLCGNGGMDGIWKSLYVPVGCRGYIVDYQHTFDGNVAIAAAVHHLMANPGELVYYFQLPLSLQPMLENEFRIDRLESAIVDLILGDTTPEVLATEEDKSFKEDRLRGWQQAAEQLKVATHAVTNVHVVVSQVEISASGVVKVALKWMAEQ